jgi:hypothetical protein
MAATPPAAESAALEMSVCDAICLRPPARSLLVFAMV